MADSLFDNRYRYDYIYPRGRSGETLRAVDTQEGDRPVVIKRPAPNDAPPIRAGQEVSILNERKALTRLAGHAVATALLGGGQFFVGGTAHQYIVMERGQGLIVADMVHELAQRELRMPELEMLVIIDGLLDLLQTAHGRDIVYNDVDAKHLFWDRENYRLKVIDWGNAVFLEGDEITAQGISRQSDIFQVGELLYFIVSGGSRVDVPRDAGEDFILDFGREAERVSPRLQTIISKAVHPNSKLRYKTIADLRKALSDYRDPLERERNSVLGRVTERLRHNRSKDELQGLMDALTPVLETDPGHPQARSLAGEIDARLRDLEVGADIDAARIYLESANWARAVDLLDELLAKSRGETRSMVELLLEFAQTMMEARLNASPQAVLDAIYLIFEHQNQTAANTLLTTRANDDRTRSVQWLLAERISAFSADVLLLRPNLYRMDAALMTLAGEGMAVTEPRAVLAEINATLDRLANPNASSLIELRDGYRSVVDALTALGTLLDAVNNRYNLVERKLPISSLERALNAAMALADNMHVIGRQATSSPRDALHALDSSRSIDPTSPAWDSIGRMLDGMYAMLGSYQTYVPAADGSDLEGWLAKTRQDLLPFQGRLFDELLAEIIGGLEGAAQSWSNYADATIQGDRFSAINSLTEAIDGVTTISPTLAGWLNQVRTIITNAQYIERHALYGGLGRALADGWEAFDRGRLSDAERLGQQAHEIARNDPQRFAAARLRDLAMLARPWLERNTVNNTKGTQVTLVATEKLYTPDELTTRDNFAAQMPSKETYLRAMGKGLVELYSRSSTAAPRVLFFNAILFGTLDANEGGLEDADFWREAGIKALGENGAKHPLTRALADFIDRRRAINEGAELLNSITQPSMLATLESTRKKLEDNPQARTLGAGIHSLRELEASLRDWSDGEFRAAGIKLENAINGVNEIEQAASVTLTQYRAWLMELQAGAAELHNQLRQVTTTVEQRPEKPVEGMGVAHRRMVDVTTRLLGELYATSLRAWRDTYESFLGVYTDHSVRRSERLNRFNQLFRAMFIDRHPAYPLYRHWYDLTDHAPEFPAPPTNEPTPQLHEDEVVSQNEYQGSRYADPPEIPATLPQVGISRKVLLAGGGGLLLIVIVLILSEVLSGNNNTPQVQITITDTPETDLTATNIALNARNETNTFTPTPTDTLDPNKVTPTLPVALVTPTVIPTATGLPTLPPPPLLTFTQEPSATPTLTWTPSITPTQTNSPTPTNTSTATLPPQGLQGEQDLLALFNNLPAFPWESNQFSLVTAIDNSYWRLGSTELTEPDTLTLAIPTDLLETYYGNNAAARLWRMDVEMTLTTFNPSLLGSSQVFFGAAFVDAADTAKNAGMHIQLLQPGVFSLGQRLNDSVTTFSQRSVTVYVARIRLERDAASGAVTVYFNGEVLGKAMPLNASDSSVLPMLYVKNGGVIVSVTNWKITFR